MKPGKTLLIIAIIIIVLLLLAWAVSMSNKRKTAEAISNQKPADANILGRHIAVASIGTDFTEIVNGKPKWLWGGNNNCTIDYTKITSGVNAGWCILTESISERNGFTCLQKDNTGKCIKWQENGNTYIKA